MDRIAPAIFTTSLMRGLNDLILREGGLQAVLLPAVVFLAYKTAMLALGGGASSAFAHGAR